MWIQLNKWIYRPDGHQCIAVCTDVQGHGPTALAWQVTPIITPGLTQSAANFCLSTAVKALAVFHTDPLVTFRGQCFRVQCPCVASGQWALF